MAAAARDRAIHLGTYEAAIDSLHWRMENQGEADRAFYLHQVALRSSAAIDPCVHEDIGESLSGYVPLAVVTDGGYNVRRYINGVEHRGSISVAVALDAILHVQTIPVPVVGLALAEEPTVTCETASCGVAIDSAVSTYLEVLSDLDSAEEATEVVRSAHLSPAGALLRERISEILGSSARGSATYERDKRSREAWSRFDSILAETYLHGVSSERRATTADALGYRGLSRRTPAAHHGYFRAHSALLARPQDVIALLSGQPAYRAPVLDKT